MTDALAGGFPSKHCCPMSFAPAYVLLLPRDDPPIFRIAADNRTCAVLRPYRCRTFEVETHAERRQAPEAFSGSVGQAEYVGEGLEGIGAGRKG